MRRVFLWAARNRWLKERLPADAIHEAGRPPLHARRDARRRADGRRPARAGRHHDDVHAPRREPREPRRSRRRGRSLPRRPRPDQGVRHARRDLGQAHPARPRRRHRRLPRPPRHAREPCRRDRLVPVGRHGGQRLHRGHDRPVRAASRGRAADRHLPAGVPAPDGRRHRSPPAARSGDPPGQGRLRRARGDRLPRQERASIRASPASPSTSSWRARAGRSSWASAPTTWGSSNRSPTRWPSPGSAGTATRSRCCTASARTSRSGSSRPATRSDRSSPTASTGIRGTCAAWPSGPANIWFALRQILPYPGPVTRDDPMPDPDAQIQNQIRNIEASTGRSMDDWVALVRASGKTKHGEIVAWLKSDHGLTHGNANLIALIALRGPDAPKGDDLVDAIYSGPKAPPSPVPRPDRGHGGRVRRRRRAGAEAGVRQPAPLEAVRDGRSGLGRSARDRPEPQGRRTGRAVWRRVAGCAPIASACRIPPSSMPRSSAGCARPTTGPDRWASGTLSRGPVAQRQSTGLLIPWSWVRIPPGSRTTRQAGRTNGACRMKSLAVSWSTIA